MNVNRELGGERQSGQNVLTEPKHGQTWDDPFSASKRERLQTPR